MDVSAKGFRVLLLEELINQDLVPRLQHFETGALQGGIFSVVVILLPSCRQRRQELLAPTH